MRIAAYLSGHGYGHAMRGSLVLAALKRHIPRLHISLKTRAPRWLFTDLDGDIAFNQTPVDVPPVQIDAFTMEIHQTVEALKRWIAKSETWIHKESQWLKAENINIVIADISPWASAAAHAAGVPSALIGNFTWDWIYSNLSDEYSLFDSIIPILRAHYSKSDWVFVPEPAALIMTDTYPIHIGMIGKQCLYSREEVRKRMSLPSHVPLVLITFGGIGANDFDFEKLNAGNRFVFMSTEPRPNLKRCITFDPKTVEHACLMQAADVVVGKLGYGTVVESIIHGTPILYTPRDGWPENRILTDAVANRIPARALPRQRFISCDWLESLNELLDSPRGEPQSAYGADQITLLLSQAVL